MSTLPGAEDRRSPYANWYYHWAVLTYRDPDGKLTDICTGSHDISLRSLEGWNEYAAKRIGTEVGFGPHPKAIIIDVEIKSTGILPGTGKFVEIIPEASGIFIKSLVKSRLGTGCFSHAEHMAIDWLRTMSGRRFELTEKKVQFNDRQFYNTIGYPETPGGYSIPKQFCQEVTTNG